LLWQDRCLSSACRPLGARSSRSSRLDSTCRPRYLANWPFSGHEISTGRAAAADDAGVRRIRRHLTARLAQRRRHPSSELEPWRGQRVPSEPGYVLSPGGWTPPRGTLPAWNWVPPEGAMPRLDVVPRWVRVWYAIPLIDRYAHVWMWAHGGWEVRPPSPLPPRPASVSLASPCFLKCNQGPARPMPQEEVQRASASRSGTSSLL
jgi:hypothetical protein